MSRTTAPGRGLALAVLLALCGGAGAAPAPVMRFVTEPFSPYSYEAKGEAAGPMADVLRAVCAELQWRCSIEVLPWRRTLAMAQRGEAEGIFSVVDTPERRAYFHMSAPVVDARYTLFARAGDDFQLRDNKSLRGRTIGAYGPSNTLLALDELVEGLEDVKTETEADNLTVLRKLSAGRYGSRGLALVNESVALALMRDNQIAGLQAAGSVKSFAYAFGLNRQRVKRRDFEAFNKALIKLCRSGRSAELIKPYALPASACAKAAG